MRRPAIALVVLLALSAPVLAQTPGKVYRLGLLAQTDQSIDVTREHTLPELAKFGFVEGANLVLDARIGPAEALRGLARELTALRTDAMLAIGSASIRAARAATSTVPIVMFGDDPVGLGVAETLSRPGGNVTGVTILVAELDAKRLQLLQEALPAARRVAALLHLTNERRDISKSVLRAVASGAGLELVTVDSAGPEDYAAAYATLRQAGVQALVIGPSPLFARDGEQLAALALEAQLPTACEWAEMARAGCLIGFGPNRPELRRRAAHYVARIFRGANPAELPIEAPTHFELAINLRTARALGLEIPPALLARADEVIE